MNTPITAQELIIKEFPPETPIVSPWLMGGQISMLHAWRGVGKSFFALTLAQAVASGSAFFKWPTQKGKVLYLDAEMGQQTLRDRLIKIDDSAAYSADSDGIKFFTYEQMGGYPWNLSLKENQEAIERMSEDINLLIIDNLDAFSRALPREHTKQTWYRMRDWLIKFTTRTRSVFMLHHSGKNGTQRGLSDYEDPLATSLNIKRPEGHHISHGTKFEFHFEKSRNLTGEDLESLLIELIPLDDGTLKWLWSPLNNYQAEQQEKRNKLQKELEIFGENKKYDDPF